MGIIEVKGNCKLSNHEVDEVKVTIILEVDTALHMRMGLHKQADDVTNKYGRGMRWGGAAVKEVVTYFKLQTCAALLLIYMWLLHGN